MTEQEMISIAITAATVFVIVEQKNPIGSAKQAIDSVDKSIDAVIKGFKIAPPNASSMRYISLATDALIDDGGRALIEGRVKLFTQGTKGVFEHELVSARLVIERHLRKVGIKY
jgi:hypothetical protein